MWKVDFEVLLLFLLLLLLFHHLENEVLKLWSREVMTLIGFFIEIKITKTKGRRVVCFPKKKKFFTFFFLDC